MELTTSTVTNCEPCGLSKSKQNISRLKQTTPSRILGKVHVGVVGSITEEGVNGERYWMLRTDGKSRRHFMSTSDSRAALGAELVTWCRQMKAQLGFTVITFHFDNAREFVGARLKVYTDSEGITIETLPPYDATRNGIAERANGVDEDRTRAALQAAGLPPNLWPYRYAAKYMARLHNLLSCSALPGRVTPMEI
jgi:hypothetical protein